MERLNNVLQFVREDDFVEYYLFPAIHTNDETEQESILKTVLEKAEKVIKKHAENYLWHKDGFKFAIRTNIGNYLTRIEKNNEEELPPHLYGVSHYGDNIEDEWFIVYILQQLTKEIEGAIGKILDSDGEFLLIEAADFLPQWADPETCDNRVYIYGGNVHLIPLEDPENSSITVSKALAHIKSQPSLSLASENLQNCLKNKLSMYPKHITDNLHYVTIYVPTTVAAILKHKPNLIAPAIQAFCNRDSIDMKACRAMKYFPPEQRVKARVAFTKCLYAMTLHSKYLPDRKIGWNLPPTNSPEYKSHILGIKVACGFEILASHAKQSTDIEGDRGWEYYFKSLKDKGYFKGYLEHSKDYNNLLNKAKEYYTSHRDSMQYSPSIGKEVLELSRTLDVNYEQLLKEGEKLQKDDDDSWLDVSPEDLDKMLQEKYGQKQFFKVDNSTEAGSFAEKINSFLNHISDIEGAEFPDEASKTKKAPDNKVNFDPNSFACSVQNILNFVIPEDDSWDSESDSDMSEYENDDYVKSEPKEGPKTKMQQYMEQMDKELASTTIGESFEKKNGDNFEDIENFKPVDIDMTALKNILESYKSQLGEAGPSSNMLGPMGVLLDPKD